MKSNVFISILFLLSTSTAFAAEQVAEQGGDYGEVTRVLGSLMVVIFIIFFLAYFLKKLKVGQQFSIDGPIKVVATLPVGTKEKLILVQVGEEQILVGMSAQGLQPVHTLKKPVDVALAQSDSKFMFSEQLKKVLSKNGLDNRKEKNLEEQS